jgi:hypothetical protein
MGEEDGDSESVLSRHLELAVRIDSVLSSLRTMSFKLVR